MGPFIQNIISGKNIGTIILLNFVTCEQGFRVSSRNCDSMSVDVLEFQNIMSLIIISFAFIYLR